MKNKTTILSVFPGLGKTYLSDHQDDLNIKVIDIDNIYGFDMFYDKKYIHYIIDNYGEIVDESLFAKYGNSNYPDNIVNKIIEKYKSGSYDFILIGINKHIRLRLYRRNIPYSLIFPSDDIKFMYNDRFTDKGIKDFNLNSNWEVMRMIYMHEINHVEICNNLYLFDYVKNYLI